jgi:hypothetical protein
MEAILEQWSGIPSLAKVQRPHVVFLAPEWSSDRRVMSLPIRIEGQTLGSRSLFQTSAASELHIYLPASVLLDVEIGVTEPAIDGSGGWRHDWWNPWRPMPGPSPEMLQDIRRRGGRVVDAEELPDILAPVRGWARFKRRLCRRVHGWCREA